MFHVTVPDLPDGVRFYQCTAQKKYIEVGKGDGQ